jgi:hypothetical protein
LDAAGGQRIMAWLAGTTTRCRKIADERQFVVMMIGSERFGLSSVYGQARFQASAIISVVPIGRLHAIAS